MRRLFQPLLFAVLLFGVACAGLDRPATAPSADLEPARLEPAPAAPAGAVASRDERPALPWAETLTIQADGPYMIDARNLPPAALPADAPVKPRVVPAPKRLLSDEQVAALREAARNLPPNDRVIRPGSAPGGQAPTLNTSFPTIDYPTTGTGLTPPDPELAVGPNHAIAIVNAAFEIYDKTGAILLPSTTLASFFAGVPDCDDFLFDPNVLYDEVFDRFIIGADDNGTQYCVAVTTGSDPTLTYFGYNLQTDVGGAFFDYPHAGVGSDAIYMGSNQFGGVPGFEGRVWAMDKVDMYAGLPLVSVTQSTGSDGTPWPADFHGANDGSFPPSGSPHWIMTEVFDGCIHNVWTWTDPFGANSFVKGSNLDLCAFTGIGPGFPLSGPQLGGGDIYDIMDWRGQSTHYRNGVLHIANQGFACNPGGGTVDCVRWAQIDPIADAILDAGVFGTNNDYRGYASVAANRCNDMAIGYSNTNSGIWPETRVTGREATDPPGTLQPEVILKLGEETFDCFDGAPYRWGDYTGMTIDPDGVRFWYLGQYSKTTGAS